MSPQVVIALVSSNHHGDCVQADKGTNVALDIRIPWALNFFRHRDRVAIGRGNGGWLLDTEIGGRLRQLLQQKRRPLFADLTDNGAQAIPPSSGFEGVDIYFHYALPS